MFTALAVLVCIGAGTIGGVFFAFSSFIMKALAQVPAPRGILAMQRMNVVVLNPVFLGAFLGTAFLAAAGGVVSFLPWVVPRSPLLFAAGLLYVVGCFFVTIRSNVPLNNRLARLEPDSPAAAAEWSTYLREWTAWNHVRTAASLASAGFSAAALAT